MVNYSNNSQGGSKHPRYKEGKWGKYKVKWPILATLWLSFIYNELEQPWLYQIIGKLPSNDNYWEWRAVINYPSMLLVVIAQ